MTPWKRVERIGDATLYLGDALHILPTLDAASVHMVMTDPPYGHNNNNNGDLIHQRVDPSPMMGLRQTIYSRPRCRN